MRPWREGGWQTACSLQHNLTCGEKCNVSSFKSHYERFKVFYAPSFLRSPPGWQLRQQQKHRIWCNLITMASHHNQKLSSDGNDGNDNSDKTISIAFNYFGNAVSFHLLDSAKCFSISQVKRGWRKERERERAWRHWPFEKTSIRKCRYVCMFAKGSPRTQYLDEPSHFTSLEDGLVCLQSFRGGALHKRILFCNCHKVTKWHFMIVINNTAMTVIKNK